MIRFSCLLRATEANDVGAEYAETIMELLERLEDHQQAEGASGASSRRALLGGDVDLAIHHHNLAAWHFQEIGKLLSTLEDLQIGAMLAHRETGRALDAAVADIAALRAGDLVH